MPAWITSLLRDDVAVPMPSAASRMITSRPANASARATARPTTPAPTTTQSTDSTRCLLGGMLARRNKAYHRRHDVRRSAAAAQDPPEDNRESISAMLPFDSGATHSPAKAAIRKGFRWLSATAKESDRVVADQRCGRSGGAISAVRLADRLRRRHRRGGRSAWHLDSGHAGPDGGGGGRRNGRHVHGPD